VSARGVRCGPVSPASNAKVTRLPYPAPHLRLLSRFRVRPLIDGGTRAGGKSGNLGTGAFRFLPEGNIHAQNVTLTVLFHGNDNHHIRQWLQVAFGGSL
jgi:hypothetical protein